MAREPFLLIAAFYLIVSGCSSPDPISESATGGGGSVTLWTEKTELFMEYPAIVVGRDARFAVHLTNIRNFQPVTAGNLSLEFALPGGYSTRATLDGPSSPGIYRPVARFERAGSYQARLILSGEGADTIAIEMLPVYASHADLPPADDETGGGELITFLKEQQWKIDFRTMAVKRESISGSIHSAGEIVPRLNGEAIVAAPFTGFVPAGENERLPVPGSSVTPGTMLAVMVPSAETPGGSEDFSSRYTDALTARDLAARDYERAKSLYAIEGISDREYQEAEAELRRTEATLGALGSIVSTGTDSAQGSAVVRFLLRAPIAGTVAGVFVVPGKQVDAGEPLFRIIDMSSVWVRVNVPVMDIGNISRPKMAWMNISGLKEPYLLTAKNGRLVSIGSAVDEDTRSVPVIFEVGNQDRRLRVGMNGEVYISTGDEHPALVVPESALIEEEGRYSVYVQVEGEAFARRDVRLGAREPDRVEILSGLRESERVVTVGAYQVRLASLSSQLPAHGHEH